MIIADPAAVAEDERKMLAPFAPLHSNLDAAKESFYSKDGKETMEMIRDALPGYEKAYHFLFQRVEAHDLVGAKARSRRSMLSARRSARRPTALAQ